MASAFFISPQVKAQFTLDAEVRPRGEVTHSKKMLAGPKEEAVFGISQRTRLNTGFKSKYVDLYVSLQDIRMWGGTPQLASTSGATTWLHQAYGVAHVASWLDLKLGRQEIILDDHRIFGSVGWAQQARSHDAAIFKFKPDDKTKIDFGVAYNPNKLISTPAGNYKTFQYLWLNRKFGKFQASILFLNNGKQVTNTLGADSLMYISPTTTDTSYRQYYQDAVYFTQTMGFRAGYAAEKFSAFGAFYYQMGNNGGNAIAVTSFSTPGFSITKKKTAAMLARIDLSGKLGPVTLSGGYEYQSGNSQVTPDVRNQAFSPFYGTNHKFNGHMDYFYVGNHFGSVGLHDAFLGAKFTHKGFWVGATGHYFAAANDVADPTLGTKMNSGLGGEIDLSLGYKVSPALIFVAGYSHMFGTPTLKKLMVDRVDPITNPQVSDFSGNGSWAFLQVIFKPKLFNSDNFKRKQQEKKEG